MPGTVKRSDFLTSEEGLKVRRELEQMVSSGLYNTESSYSANSLLYPDMQIPFVEKHMIYLVNHPNLEASKYLANIKLMSRVR